VSGAVARILAFFTSAAVLVLEILAGRLLAPYVGVTLQTYTSIIGVVLAGIALGSWTGGLLADRIDPRVLVGPTMMVGGGLGLLSAPIVRLAAGSLDGTSVLVVFVATVAGFFLPSVVLSMVSPMLVKTQLRSLESSGATVGSMSAIGTTGSIVGTFVTGFVLVAKVAVTTTVVSVGATLIAVGAILTLTVRRKPKVERWTTVGLLAFGGFGVSSAFAVDSPCQLESAYYCASVFSVVGEPRVRVLHLDNLDHSEVDLDDPASLRFDYTRLFGVTVDALPPGPVRAVHLGGGAFTMPRYVRATRPGSTGVVLEVDGALPKLAERSLGWKPGPDVTVRIGDGRVTMGRLPAGRADIVFGDAFGAEAVPWHLTTEEFTATIRRVLRPGGVYALNAIDADRHGFVRAEVATIGAVFDHVAVLAPADAFTSGAFGSNFVVVASDAPLPLDRYRALIAERGYDSVILTDAALRRWVGASPILRDDFAPVDQLFSTGE
jgi:spermidine synthase